MATLYPPRLAGQFAPGTPSAPGTPVHSIQTLRRKSAGHHGPLTKILVANRGVSCLTLYSIASGPDPFQPIPFFSD
jgi:pyruvate carboxylase